MPPFFNFKEMINPLRNIGVFVLICTVMNGRAQYEAGSFMNPYGSDAGKTPVQAASTTSEWTTEELISANTAVNVMYLTELEKEVILYVNLARLYPEKFARIEVADYVGPAKYGGYLENSPYKRSLMERLNSMSPCPTLSPTAGLSDYASCFAKESGDAGITGHSRKKCEKGYFAECCSYGMDTARDIVLQLLIDHDVESLGHRKICLDPNYRTIGTGFHSHSKYGSCCVLDII